MTRRALGGALVAVVLALGAMGFLPQPAQAAQAPAVSITTPAEGWTAQSAANIAGSASMTNGKVDWADISVESTQGRPAPGTHRIAGNDTKTLPFNWMPPLAYNGQYKVTVVAQGTEGLEFNGPETGSATRMFFVNIAPGNPTGVKAAANQTKRTITISWAKNPEPDILGYGVYRKEGDGYVQRAIIDASKPTTYTDELGQLPAGTYSYQVFAARAEATGQAPIVSGPTATAAKITTAPPTPPTTSGTVTGSSNTAGGGHSSTTAPPSSGSTTPALATRGKVDLSGFTSLLPSGGAKLPNVKSTPAPDSGFNEQLPFDARAGEAEVTTPTTEATSEQALDETLASSNDDSSGSLRFMAAGLLVTVVLMHLLWLRDEVNRDPLPAVAVDELDISDPS